MFKSSSSPPFARLRDDEDSTSTAPFPRGEDDEDLDLLENDEAASAVFNYSPRPKTDRTFASVFLLITISCFLLGTVVVSNTNAKAFAQRTSEDVLFSTNCEAYRASSSSPTSRLLLSNKDEFKDTNDDLDDVFDGDDFWQSSHAWLLLAIVSAVALGVTFLYGFQYHASKATWGIIGFKLLSSFSFSLYMFAEGFVFGGCLFLLVTLILARVFYLWREEIALVNRLLQTAATALSDQKHTLTATIGINMFVSMFVFIPFIFFMSYAWMHGKIGANRFAMTHPSDGSKCIDRRSYDDYVASRDEGATGDMSAYVYEVNCCEWQTDSWVKPFVGLLFFSLLWTSSVAVCLRLFTIGGSTAQWYFAPSGTTAFKGTVKRSLSHGLKSQFGTICFGGLIMSIVDMVRNMFEKAQREHRKNAAMAALMCCVNLLWQCFAEIIGFISKFAIVYAAISGDAFCDSARKVTTILQNNMLSTFAVWWLPPMILRTTAFIVSVVFGVVFGLSSSNYFDDESRSVEVVFLGVFCFLISLTILNFCLTVLLDVVDAVYLCYAVDKDLQMLTKPEIHDVMDEVVKKQTKNAGGFNTNNNAFNIANPFAANNRNSNNNNSNNNEMSAMAGAPQQQQQQQQQQQVVIGYPQQRSGQDQRPTVASHEDIDAV
jgi:hypothetical protein